MEGDERQEHLDEEDDDCVDSYLYRELSDKIEDEFKYFTTAEPTLTPQDQFYDWWSEQYRLPRLR